MDNLGQIKVFIRVTEAHSFTSAGRTLGISSSGVGKAISRLEERIGVRLFHRNTRTITLTAEGNLFLDRCHRIIAELDAAEVELSDSSHVPRGRLHVSLPLVGMLMMPILVRFMRDYPLVELDLDFTDRLVDLINEGFDVAVRTGETGEAFLAARTFGQFRHHIVGAPGYFERRGVPASPADLAAHDCLLHKFPGSGKLAPWIFSEDEQDFAVALPRTVVASTIEPLLYMAEEGLGLACLPDYAVHDKLARGTLRAVLTTYMRQQGVLRALWPPTRHETPKVQLFIDYLAAHLFPRQAGDAA